MKIVMLNVFGLWLYLCPFSWWMWAVNCILAELIRSKPLFPGKSHTNQVQLIFEVMGDTPGQNLGFEVGHSVSHSFAFMINWHTFWLYLKINLNELLLISSLYAYSLYLPSRPLLLCTFPFPIILSSAQKQSVSLTSDVEAVDNRWGIHWILFYSSQLLCIFNNCHFNIFSAVVPQASDDALALVYSLSSVDPVARPTATQSSRGKSGRHSSDSCSAGC